MPCDTGGLEACVHWATWGMSPGEPVDPLVARILETHHQLTQMGWEMVRDFLTLELTAGDAEVFFEGLRLLKNWDAYYAHLARQQAQQQG